MSEQKVTKENQLVVFSLGKECYGVDISIVREIIQLQPVTKVPGTPYSVEGMINLRGSVIPIVDLRKRFKLHSTSNDKDTRIVVVNCNKQDTGIIVDSVEEVLRIPVDSIEPPSTIVTGEKAKHLRGIVKLSQKLIILLDMDEVLARVGTFDVNQATDGSALAEPAMA